MAYSESLASRTRHVLANQRGVTEKKMFGGLAFFWHGQLAAGIWSDALIVRVEPASASQYLQEPQVQAFASAGRPMRGWLLIDAEAVENDNSLKQWIERAMEFVRSLPPKTAKPRKAAGRAPTPRKKRTR